MNYSESGEGAQKKGAPVKARLEDQTRNNGLVATAGRSRTAAATATGAATATTTGATATTNGAASRHEGRDLLGVKLLRGTLEGREGRRALVGEGELGRLHLGHGRLDGGVIALLEEGRGGEFGAGRGHGRRLSLQARRKEFIDLGGLLGRDAGDRSAAATATTATTTGATAAGSTGRRGRAAARGLGGNRESAERESRQDGGDAN
jgi:hypothetical protein